MSSPFPVLRTSLTFPAAVDLFDIPARGKELVTFERGRGS